MRRLFSVFLLLVFVIGSVNAARPYLTEDAGTSEKGAAGIEVGFEWRNPSDTLDSSLVFKYGFLGNLEAAFEIPYRIKGEGSGILDTFNIGCKYNFIKLDDEPFLSAVFNVSDLPKDERLYRATAVVTKTICGANVHSNFGGSFSSGEFDGYMWGAAIGIPLTNKFDVALEIHSERTHFDKACDENYVTSLIGCACKLTENFIIDGGLRLPLTAASKSATPSAKNDYYVVVGVTFNL